MAPWLDRSKPTLLVLSQVYVPDPAGVGQHMHDVAAEMVRRGHRVVVIAADRGYDEPSRKYLRREQLDGVNILRVPFASFGKASIPIRLAGGVVYVTEAVLVALTLARIDQILVSTSPPMCSLAGVTLSRMRNVPVTFWAMDLNPDQIVATGALEADALPVRAFDWINRQILKHAHQVVALDRFMGNRLETKWPLGEKLSVVPPWSPVGSQATGISHEDNPFRIQHGLQGKFVVMYSGNLSPLHPVTTVLEAASALRDDQRLMFVFVGGGLGRADIQRQIDERNLTNVLCLPYQPIATLPHSLSAADVHLVSMGNDMVGIVHPCKIYGAMAVGRPVLGLGPKHSHLAEILQTHDTGFLIEHDDVDGAEAALHTLLRMPEEALQAMGQRARVAAATHYDRTALCGRLCDLLGQASDAWLG